MLIRLFEIDKRILSRDEKYFYFVNLIITDEKSFEKKYSILNDVAQNLKISEEDLAIIANKCNAVKDGFTCCFNDVEDAQNFKMYLNAINDVNVEENKYDF